MSEHVPSWRCQAAPMRDVAWRTGLLRAAGLDDELSSAVACGRGHDVHQLLRLLDRGCPPATAVRIAAVDTLDVTA